MLTSGLQHHPNVYANQYSSSRFSNNGHAPSAAPSATQSEISVVTTREKAGTAPMLGAAAPTNTVGPYLWDTKDPDLDDALHNPDPVRDAALDRSFTLFSARGWMNASALFLLVGGLLMLFAGYPIILFVRAKKPGDGYLTGLKTPTTLPSWLTEEDLAHFVKEFSGNGFRSSLNRYRNMDRDWEELPELATVKIQQPALFIIGEEDPGRAFAPIEPMKALVPHLHELVLVPGATHWVQQERPAEVNAALLSFLKGLPQP